jgi:dipeptidyl aminopeptidase/acylaminoacyl peptidase
MRLRSIEGVRLSPDGQRVAYVVSQPSMEKDEHEAALYLVSASGGEPVRLTYQTRLFNQPRPLTQLRWSPDGRLLSFLAFVDERPQVVALPADGGEARPLTTAKEGTASYEWAPDGTRIAYVSADPRTADEERRRKDKSFVIEVDRQDRAPRVWVQDLSGGEPRALTPVSHFVAGLAWSPDSKTIAYAASPKPGFMSQFHTRIYAVGAGGGDPRPVVDRDGMNTSPQYSPDGRWIAFVSTGGQPAMISVWGLHVAPADGGGPARSLSQESWIGEFTWAPDSRSVFAVPNEGTAQRGAQMFEQPILRLWLDGRRETAVGGARVHYSPSVSRDGRRLAYRSVEPLTMGDVYVRELEGGRARRLTDVNPELRELALGELKPIHWTSSDGMEVWGLLLTPPGYVAGTRVPLVVYCHGGPIGGVTYGVVPQFMHSVGQVDPYPVQAMAGAGMAVLLPMPRGGSGYGLEGFRMIRNGWGEGDYRDVMAGVDHLIAIGLADPDRLGVMGASYGGYLTNWIVTQTGRFKAASVMCSLSDLADMYFLSDGGDVMAEYFGLPWAEPEAYLRHSPITYAARVTTPLLIQHGENDRRVPIMQATKFYKALKDQGKTVEMEIYPRGGHVIYEPVLEREIMRRNLEWFRRWLRP